MDDGSGSGEEVKVEKVERTEKVERMEKENKESKENKEPPPPRMACQWEGPLSALPGHLQNDCECVLMFCTHVECPSHVDSAHPIPLLRSEVALHVASCGYRQVACVDCKYLICENYMKSHLADDCPQGKIDCETCNETMRRADEDDHECPLEETSCLYDGCEETFLRKDKEKHLVSAAHVHLDRVKQSVSSLKSLVHLLTQRVMNAEAKLDQHAVESAALKKEQTSLGEVSQH